MVGEEDLPFLAPPSLAAAIPGAVLAVIADAGHSPQFENPAAFWAVLSAFLDAERGLTSHVSPPTHRRYKRLHPRTGPPGG